MRITLFLFTLFIVQIERRFGNFEIRKSVRPFSGKKKLIINYNVAYVKNKFYPAKVFELKTALW